MRVELDMRTRAAARLHIAADDMQPAVQHVGGKAVALRLLRTDYPGATLVVLICDSGLKYLSTDLWEALE